MDYQKNIKMNKIIIISVFAISLFLGSCNEWNEIDKEVVMNKGLLSKLLTGNESFNSIKHNLDSGIIEFTISNLTIENLNEYDEKALKNGWCIIDKLINERLYVSQSSENFVNAEVLTILLDPASKTAFFTIRN